MGYDFCVREEIKNIGTEDTFVLYQHELDSLLGYAEEPCGSDRFECFLASASYDAWWDETNRQLVDIWKTRSAGSSSVCPIIRTCCDHDANEALRSSCV